MSNLFLRASLSGAWRRNDGRLESAREIHGDILTNRANDRTQPVILKGDDGYALHIRTENSRVGQQSDAVARFDTVEAAIDGLCAENRRLFFDECLPRTLREVFDRRRLAELFKTFTMKPAMPTDGTKDVITAGFARKEVEARRRHDNHLRALTGEF